MRNKLAVALLMTGTVSCSCLEPKKDFNEELLEYVDLFSEAAADHGVPAPDLKDIYTIKMETGLELRGRTLNGLCNLGTWDYPSGKSIPYREIFVRDPDTWMRQYLRERYAIKYIPKDVILDHPNGIPDEVFEDYWHEEDEYYQQVRHVFLTLVMFHEIAHCAYDAEHLAQSEKTSSSRLDIMDSYHGFWPYILDLYNTDKWDDVLNDFFNQLKGE